MLAPALAAMHAAPGRSGRWPNCGRVVELIQWDEASAAYVWARSQRCPGAFDIEPAWTQGVFDDPDYVAFEPDPKSRVGGSRIIGDSPSAGRALIVIAYRDLDGELHGVNAWPATGEAKTIDPKLIDAVLKRASGPRTIRTPKVRRLSQPRAFARLHAQ
jgi:hypothetical protein